MLNKRIRNMIDAIFAEMKMTAENLALRDELMANAQARYEDMIAQGKTEDEAFAQVAASLEDVNDLLREMNGESAPQAETDAEQPDAQPSREQETDAPQTDLGDALNKAFTALGDWGQSIMPQAKKLARQMDDATGGVLRDIGRAVNKGMQEAQRAASDVIDKAKQDANTPREADYTVTDAPETLRENAKDLRAQAGIKRAIGSEEEAEALEMQAEALETQAEAIESLAEAQAQAEETFANAQEQAQETAEDAPIFGADGELNEDAFAKNVEKMSREADDLLCEAGKTVEDLGRKASQWGDELVNGARDPQSSEVRFPVAGLREVKIKLDADDIAILPADGDEIIVSWEAQNAESEFHAQMDGHTLSVSRKNPDIFKTFFSVFSKQGGKVFVRVPRGYAADYTLSTTSGAVHLSAVDADNVTVSTTSGDVRIEPDAGVRARDLKVESVSGNVTISAMAIEISAESVTGDVFVSCDAKSVSAESVSGKVHAEGASDEWKVETVSGLSEIICTVVPGGKIKAESVSGNMTLWLPSSIRGFAVEFDAVNGKLTNEFGVNRFGTCALPIHLDTLSGNVVITRL